eukprot:5608032-Prymnesium_polylepis.2
MQDSAHRQCAGKPQRGMTLRRAWTLSTHTVAAPGGIHQDTRRKMPPQPLNVTTTRSGALVARIGLSGSTASPSPRACTGEAFSFVVLDFRVDADFRVDVDNRICTTAISEAFVELFSATTCTRSTVSKLMNRS